MSAINPILSNASIRKSLNEKSAISFEDLHPAVKNFFTKNTGKLRLVPVTKLLRELEEYGIYAKDDERLKSFMDIINAPCTPKIDEKTWASAIETSNGIITDALTEKHIIRNFKDLKANLQSIYNLCKLDKSGEVCTLTPYLSKVSPDQFGVALISNSCQTLQFGESKEKFIMHTGIHSIIYALGVELLGVNEVLKHTGANCFTKSPYTVQVLNYNGIPSNPITIAGAITLCSWIRAVGFKGMTRAETFDYLTTFLKKLAGGRYVRFSNTAYMAEKVSGAKNLAIIYYLKAKICLPVNCDIEADLDFYIAACSFEVNCESMSIIYSTIGNYGINLYTNETVLSAVACSYTLSMMLLGCLNKFWLCKVGLPVVTGASGSSIMIVPKVISICLFSPRVDENLCSARADSFFKIIEYQYYIHPLNCFSQKPEGCEEKIVVPRTCPHTCWAFKKAAMKYSLNTIKIVLTGFQLCKTNFFGRNILHEAAAEGNLEAVKFMTSAIPGLLDATDKMGFTPFDDAKFFKQHEVIAYFEKWLSLI